MGLVQKDAFRTTVISYAGILIGYLNKGILFIAILSPLQIGLVNLIVTIGTLFAQLANLGTVFATWRFFPFVKNEEKNHHGFLSLILVITGTGIVLYTLLYVVFRDYIQSGYIEKSPLFIDYYFWTLPIGIAYVIFMVLEIYLRGLYNNIVAVFSYEIVLRVATTAILLLKWMNLISFEFFVILHSFLYVIPTLILIFYLRKIGEFRIGLSQIKVSKRLRKIIVYFSSFAYLNTLGGVWIASLDVLMIAQMVGLDATGIFTTVVFLSSALQVPYKSIMRVSYPLVADYWKHREMDKMQELYVKTSSICLVIGLGLFLGVWVNIDFLFSFLKPEFKDGIWVFFFIMMGRLVDMYFGLNGGIFGTSKKYRYDIIFTLFLMISVYFVNLALIPLWGINGAAISTSITLLIYNFGRLIFVWIAFKLHPFHINQFIIIGLGILTMVISHFTLGLVDNKWIGFVIQSLLVVVCFFYPIYQFSLEPEIINYVIKGRKFAFEKLGIKK